MTKKSRRLSGLWDHGIDLDWWTEWAVHIYAKFPFAVGQFNDKAQIPRRDADLESQSRSYEFGPPRAPIWRGPFELIRCPHFFLLFLCRQQIFDRRAQTQLQGCWSSEGGGDNHTLRDTFWADASSEITTSMRT